jgi:HAD superfamily phosphatase (TIGR01668 family)
MPDWWTKWMPDEYVASIYDIDLDKLRAQGRRLLLCDLDNTLVPWNHPDPPDALPDWLRSAWQAGFDVCIVSNNRGPRVTEFSRRSGLPAIADAGKPRRRGFMLAMRTFGAEPEETVMVGDQLFTDILGAKRCGVYAILVVPLHPREWWGTRLLRRLERLVLQRLMRRGLVVRHRDA